MRQILEYLFANNRDFRNLRHDKLFIPSDSQASGYYEIKNAKFDSIYGNTLLFSAEGRSYQVPIERMQRFLDKNPDFIELAKKTFLTPNSPGEGTKIVSPNLLNHDFSVDYRIDFGAGRKVTLPSGEKGKIEGFIVKNKKLQVLIKDQRTGKTIEMLPKDLLLQNPELIPPNTPLLIRRSNGEVETWRVKGFNQETGKAIVVDEFHRGIAIKELSPEEAFEFAGNLFSRDKVLTDNPQFIPQLFNRERVFIPSQSAEGQIIGLSSDGSKIRVKVNSREVEVDPIEIVVHNRNKLFGEPDLDYEIASLQNNEYGFESGQRRIDRVEKDPNTGEWKTIDNNSHTAVQTPAIRYDIAIRGQKRIQVVFPDAVPENVRLQVLNELNGFYQSLGDSWIDSTNKIVFDPSTNPEDLYWQKAYNNPNHKSAATGGDGTITFYQGTKNFDSGVFWHEFAHNYAKQKWNNTESPTGHPDRAAWENAQQVEGLSISSYGAVKYNPDGNKIDNLAEYVAEAVRVYAQKRAEGNGNWERWRNAHPLTVRLVEPLFITN